MALAPTTADRSSLLVESAGDDLDNGAGREAFGLNDEISLLVTMSSLGKKHFYSCEKSILRKQPAVRSL